MTKEKKKLRVVLPETENARPTGLALMRAPFPANQISKLPKPTKRQTEEVRADFKKGIRCDLCGQWHHPDVVHLDYVGHAALTDRLLDCDPEWNWKAIDPAQHHLPNVGDSGMWIELTVCGVTRFGYGHAEGKRGGDAVKEIIGDALRNAAMRFGAALDLWHKGDLHVDDKPEPEEEDTPEIDAEAALKKAIEDARRAIAAEKTIESLRELWASFSPEVQDHVAKEKDARKAEITPRISHIIPEDEIPY